MLNILLTSDFQSEIELLNSPSGNCKYQKMESKLGCWLYIYLKWYLIHIVGECLPHVHTYVVVVVSSNPYDGKLYNIIPFPSHFSNEFDMPKNISLVRKLCKMILICPIIIYLSTTFPCQTEIPVDRRNNLRMRVHSASKSRAELIFAWTPGRRTSICQCTRCTDSCACVSKTNCICADCIRWQSLTGRSDIVTVKWHRQWQSERDAAAVQDIKFLLWSCSSNCFTNTWRELGQGH